MAKKKKEYTLEDIEKIKSVVTITTSDLLIIVADKPAHIPYTAILGALFESALKEEAVTGEKLTEDLVKKVVKRLSAMHQSRVTKYTNTYVQIIDTLLKETSKSVDTIICKKDFDSIKGLEEFNTCMNGFAVVKPRAMTEYFDRLMEGETEFVVIEAPKCSSGNIVFLPSDENARRISILAAAFIDYQTTTADISLILSYATTRLIHGGYEDDEFMDRIDIDIFTAMTDGMYAAKIINYFAPMVDNEFDSMSNTFFS